MTKFLMIFILLVAAPMAFAEEDSSTAGANTVNCNCPGETNCADRSSDGEAAERPATERPATATPQ